MCVDCGCGSLEHGSGGKRRGLTLPHIHESHVEDPPTDRNERRETHVLSDHEDHRRITVGRKILEKNDRLAESNRIFFKKHGILVLNLLSSPGSGKTTLLEKTIIALGGSIPLGVIEGDQATSRDADRIRQLGVPAVQINTGAGCHLDAHQVVHAVNDLELVPGMILIIENIGNLVCPALFDLGETSRIVLFSVTEGEDKPLKYPQIFRGTDLVLLSKSDLLPVLSFDRPRAENYVKSVNPGGEIMALSAETGDGMESWLAWLSARREGSGRLSETTS